MLTMSEYLVLRIIEAHPGVTKYEMRVKLEDADFPVPNPTLYRAVKTLYEFAAIEISLERRARNGVDVSGYELSDAGRQSLAKLRAFLGDPAAVEV